MAKRGKKTDRGGRFAGMHGERVKEDILLTNLKSLIRSVCSLYFGDERKMWKRSQKRNVRGQLATPTQALLVSYNCLNAKQAEN